MREKLIRDGVPVLAQAQGKTLAIRTALDQEWDRLLGLKLVEETHEVIDALANGKRGALVDELADLQTVIGELARRKGIALEEIEQRIEQKKSERGGFESGLVLREQGLPSPRLHVGGAATLIDALQRELQACTSARIAVAFVMRSGVDLLEGAIRAALLRGAEIRLLTTDYLGVTEPEALGRLCVWPGRFDVRVYSHERRSFHPKAYLFERADGSGRAFIGSANMSRMGLREGVEWTWTVLDVDFGHPMHEIRTRFDELFTCEDAQPLTPDWISAYRARRQVRPFVEALTPPDAAPTVQPREVQVLALQELDRLRSDGQSKALVVAATGLGKTFLAAFDARDAACVLFVAHREELLRQAASAFGQVYPGRTQGFVMEGRAEYDRDCVFASVQTLSRPENLTREELPRFDYVVIDEFHHAAAESYLRILQVLAPRFLLGLTATPFRGDNRDLLELCDGNLAYQVGLFEAIGFGWLVPFHYFGVADTVVYSDDMLTARRTYDASKLTLRFNTADRAELVIDRFRRHTSRAALGFCVSIENADFMAAQFVSAGIPAAAVHSASTSMDRVEAVRKLERGQLRVLFTVDMFNEGVDIPAIDLVLFVRPTESMTIFLQQLGRGLRLSDQKKFLTVLDFIGNYRNAHFKLPFLAGQDLSQDLDPGKALKLLARWTQEGIAPPGIPAGVAIELEPVALNALSASLQSATPLRQLILSDLAEMAARLKRAPTVYEWQQFGRYSLRTAMTALGVDRWHRILERAGMLEPEAKALEQAAGDFLREIETTRMNKSFKMVVLLAMCDGGVFIQSIAIEALIRFFRTYFAEDRHRGDVLGTVIEDVEAVGAATWRNYLLANPVNAWTGGNTGVASPFFVWKGNAGEFRYIGPSPGYSQSAQVQFATAVRDRALAQLHAYWRRPGPGRFVYPVIPTGNAMGEELAITGRPVCIMFGKDRESLPEGWHLVLINGKHLYGKFVQVALNVLKAVATDDRSSPNVLTREIEVLFGGRLPPRPRVRLTKKPGALVWEIVAA